MTPDAPTPQLRCSDAEREAAIEKLNKAAVEGRLSHEELEQRIAAAYSAKWVGDLARITSDVTPPPPAAPPPQPVPYAYQYPAQPAKPTNGLAIASLVSALVWFLWLGSLAAIVFGHVSLGQIKRSGGAQSGQGIAIAGLVIGYLSMIPVVLWALAAAFGGT